MTLRAPNILVGIGNLLRRDDGVGVIVAQQMSQLDLPDDVEVIDAGTAGTELAGLIERRRLVVVIDAIDAGEPPGSIFRLDPESVQPASRAGLSVHDLHFLHALDETRLLGSSPQRVVIFAVQVADKSTGIGLSEPVGRAARRLMALAAEELGLSIEHMHYTPGSDADEPSTADSVVASREVMPWH
jgi:hydrogenase maturation protease